MRNLNLLKKKNIGILDDGSTVFDYGSNFFAITEKDELVEKLFDVTSASPFKITEIIDCDNFEFLKDVNYTHNDEYSISAVLDHNNIYVKGHKIYLDVVNSIDDNTFLYCSSVDYIDFEEDDKEYDIFLNVCKMIFNNENITDLSILDEKQSLYISFTIVNNVVAVLKSEITTENISVYSLKNEKLNEVDKELAYCALLAIERIAFDECSLLSLNELEDKKSFELIKYINSLEDKDVKQKVIAEILKMNYKSLNLSPKKEMYFNLYKQKLISEVLKES